ncbi:MAG: NAD-dependent succinate-semialdehyde dehydrogenase [Rickettsiales bacterium]
MTTQVSINPATGEIIKEYPIHTEDEVENALAHAHESYLEWRHVPVAERAAAMHKVAEVILANKEKYAAIITEEMGKPFKESVAEVEKCASGATYYAQNGEAFLADRPVETQYQKSYVTFQPMGLVLGIMPWNFPFWQALRYAVPTLVAGNGCLLKHAANVPGCALAIESIFKEAGLPEHIFKTLLIPAKRVEPLIADPRICAVTLTGSTPAGKAVAAAAGKHLKKTVLELGGSDPYLVLEDCDIEHAINTCGTSRLNNCGQSCVSAKRMIVVEKHKERFEQGIAEIFSKAVQGNPADVQTTMGPMARADLRDELHGQVERSVKAGAKLVMGGKNPGGDSAFYPATILSDVKKGMPAYEEEMFGPVAVIIPVKDEEEAIAVANDTPFGLGGAVFSTDIERAEHIARTRVDSGLCFVNMMVRSDPRLPFGGIKESGYGRELALFGLHEFVNTKTIIVA